MGEKFRAVYEDRIISMIFPNVDLTLIQALIDSLEEDSPREEPHLAITWIGKPEKPFFVKTSVDCAVQYNIKATRR